MESGFGFEDSLALLIETIEDRIYVIWIIPKFYKGSHAALGHVWMGVAVVELGDVIGFLQHLYTSTCDVIVEIERDILMNCWRSALLNQILLRLRTAEEGKKFEGSSRVRGFGGSEEAIRWCVFTNRYAFVNDGEAEEVNVVFKFCRELVQNEAP